MSDVVDLKVKLSVVPNMKNVRDAGKEAGKEYADGIRDVTAKKANLKEILSGKASIKEIKESLKPLKEGIASVFQPLKSFLKRVGRIAIYRLIRTILKDIVQSLSQGINNVYQWSKALGGTFSQAMDTASTSMLYLKNSLGAALAPAIEALIPILNTVIDKFVEFINVINQLFATLSGKSTYIKAIRYQTEFAEATAGAAKATKALLLGFDELNTLTQNNGGGSASDLDYAKMFEETPIGEAFSVFKMNIKDIIFDWSDLTTEDIIAKIITGLNGLTGALIGWKFGGLGGALVGAVFGATMGAIISSMTFDGNDKLTEDELGALVWGGMFGIVGGLLGFQFKGVKGGLMGFTIGASLGMILYNTVFKDGGKRYDESTFAYLIKDAIAPMIGGVLGCIIGGPVGGFLGLTIGTIITLVVEDIGMEKVENAIKSYTWQGKVESWIDDKISTKKAQNAATKYEDYWLKYYGSNLTKYASGGTPDMGSLFLAGEAGPELVTQIGGRSTVYNEEQLGNSLAYANEGVINAINTLIGVVRTKSNNVTISASDIRKAVNNSSMRLGV